MRLWRFSFHSKSKSRTSGGGGGYKLSDNPGQTGEGGSENLDFGRTSFVNAPLYSLTFVIIVCHSLEKKPFNDSTGIEAPVIPDVVFFEEN